MQNHDINHKYLASGQADNATINDVIKEKFNYSFFGVIIVVTLRLRLAIWKQIFLGKIDFRNISIWDT